MSARYRRRAIRDHSDRGSGQRTEFPAAKDTQSWGSWPPRSCQGPARAALAVVPHADRMPLAATTNLLRQWPNTVVEMPPLRLVSAAPTFVKINSAAMPTRSPALIACGSWPFAPLAPGSLGPSHSDRSRPTRPPSARAVKRGSTKPSSCAPSRRGSLPRAPAADAGCRQCAAGAASTELKIAGIRPPAMAGRHTRGAADIGGGQQ